MKKFSDVDPKMLRHLQGYECTQCDRQVFYQKIEIDAEFIPTIFEITWNFIDATVHCVFISVSDKAKTTLRSVTQLENFSADMWVIADELAIELLNEINKHRFKKKTIIFGFKYSIFVNAELNVSLIL